MPPLQGSLEEVIGADADDSVASIEPILRTVLHALYDPILDEPLSERLQAVIREIRAGLPSSPKSPGRHGGH